MNLEAIDASFWVQAASTLATFLAVIVALAVPIWIRRADARDQERKKQADRLELCDLIDEILVSYVELRDGIELGLPFGDATRCGQIRARASALSASIERVLARGIYSGELLIAGTAAEVVVFALREAASIAASTRHDEARAGIKRVHHEAQLARSKSAEARSAFGLPTNENDALRRL